MNLYPEPEIKKLSMDKFRYNILLAPFQPATRIELEAKINTNVECYLDVKNAGDKTLNVLVTKLPSVERRIDLSLSKLEIQGHSNRTLCIKWSPREAGRWRDVLQLTDSRRIKYDIVIATTAKDDKKSNKTKRLKPGVLSNMSSLSTLTISKQSHQNNMLKVPSISQSLSSSLANNLDTQINQYKLDLDKENILNKNNGTKNYALETKDYGFDGMHHERHDKPENILCEQNINVWSDSSVLPQVFLPLNAPQDIRRATYIKERRPCNSILYEHHKEVHENMKCNKDETQSDFSVLLNKFTFTSTDVISSSPTRRESTESTTSHIIDKHKTFNISRQFFETSAIYDKKTTVNAAPVLQPTSLYNLSPIKSDKCSLMTGIKDLISSSPIQFQHYIPKDSNEYIKHFMVDKNPNIETTNCEYFSFEIIPRNAAAAKKTGDMYIEISPPKKHFCSKMVSKVNSARIGRVMKNNTLCDGRNRKKLQVNIAAKNDTKNIPAIKINKFSLSSTLCNTKWHTSSSRDSSFRIRNKEEYFIYETCGLDPFAPSTIEDPFLKNTVFNEPWLLQQELTFTKWLNALLSSPEDLSVDIETAIVDIGKVWQTCKAQKNTVLAETKEAVSARYHTNTQLNTLRKAANAMFKRDEVTQILSRTNMYITKGTLCIRSDRNLHRDIGLQKLILSLFLSYNPLWLRIGLETVYNENISLRSNNDIVGLTRFLLTRFFSNPRLTKMPGYHKTNSSQKLVTLLNQFSLRKFLFLIYFLDYAKQHKLIGHDPCLFHKRAQYKESREILLSFSRELLSGIGDVTRMLRGHNYVLTYRQTYIEEYDYAVVNIRHDLRDGVRLCRAMELITGTRGLAQRCRVPAISRLQKIHNVDMALSALCQAGYVLEGNIDAKSIADGHCEKTLSLLWQIIHKYQAPRFDRAARVIQKWWRAQLWYIYVRNFLSTRKNLAATVIQRMWRCKQAQSLHVIETDGNLEERKRYLCIRAATIQIQRWWKQMRKTKMQELRKRHKAVIMLQRRWKATLLMQMQQSLYHNLKNAALTIQIHWRATRAMKLQRSKYLMLRNATKIVQSWWRSVKAMQKQREWFLRSRESSCIIQTWWRQHLLVRKARHDFLHKRAAVRNIERWWLSVLDRKKFILYRKSTVLIQRTWNKYQMRKREVACLKIQAWWRAAMYSHRYRLQKYSCLKLQRWWRRLVLMRHQHFEFLQLQKVVHIIQKNWRAKTIRKNYLKQRQAALLIQSWYRRVNSARAIRRRYLKMRGAATRIQNWWHNITVAHQERRRYLQLRKSAVFLQTYWYRRVLARADRQRYLTKRKACVIIQSWWRMIKTKSEYKRFMVHVLEMQRRWRAKKVTRIMRREYLLTRATIVVQARWRALTARKRFVALRQATIVIQSCYRMKIAIRRYEASKYAAMVIQAYWRAYIVGREERLRYLSLYQATIMLQRRYKRKKIERELQCHVNDIALLATKIQDECGETIQAITTKLASSDYWQKKINVLRSCNSVGMLLTCLYSLDTITILSPTVCIILCELNLADDIYNTIVQNNRSLPWMKVCLRACSILITLSKYSYTRKYVLKKEYALALIKLLNRSLKDKEVFLHCATLIWLLSQNEDYAKAIAMCPQINYLMKNIQHFVLKDAIVVKLQKFKDPEKLYPNCEPDRNNLTMQKPRLFTDMSIAVTAIVKRICT
ncbi:PREDICTED: protein abnormal spindle [Trachymyrmex cornetzi]|uniref:Protein abnormal spindle n=1 Tax=Trachymyrmex cornetzi TaxID=471704 RepID=A0A195DV47_9HYME|nr:PREDICTED: protein abnormal spindle [Trachymyrmex cornetzi]XP_018367597.1 PREDICTED: protein abnormal spindle [Trachymyrmex cornetzi]KYN16622.1 Protein abnormal spindle [Trachymyrmex cornetzi]